MPRTIKRYRQNLGDWWSVDEHTPKDRPILCFNPDWISPLVLKWSEADGSWQLLGDDSYDYQPTYWQPLPRVPTVEEIEIHFLSDSEYAAFLLGEGSAKAVDELMRNAAEES